MGARTASGGRPGHASSGNPIRKHDTVAGSNGPDHFAPTARPSASVFTPSAGSHAGSSPGRTAWVPLWKGPMMYVCPATLAETSCAYRVLETSHPPVYYFPPEDVLPGVLIDTARNSYCEFKGAARHFTVTAGGKRAEDAAWAYPDPSPPFAVIRDHFAFYPGRMDACTVDGELVVPQPGGFYGGWITGDVVGPFKGGPGTAGW
jgi:uncharacterized protein (DUF427 family)